MNAARNPRRRNATIDSSGYSCPRRATVGVVLAGCGGASRTQAEKRNERIHRTHERQSTTQDNSPISMAGLKTIH
jgi:hypothetical protein